MRFLSTNLLLLLAVPVGCHAQPPALDARTLRLGIDTLAVYAIRGTDTTLTGMIVDELTLRSAGDRQLLVRTYHSRDRLLGTNADTLIDEFPTLAPVRHRSWRDGGSEHLEFELGRVRGFLRLANGDSVVVDQSVPSQVINASSFDLALRAAELKPDWSGQFSAFLSNSRTIGSMSARVAGLDEVGGTTCWRVEAEFAGLPVTFWIDQDSRRLCQQVMVLRPDLKILFAAPRATRSTNRAT